MNFNKLNPFIRSASLYEKSSKGEECIGYDAKIIYVISGDIAAVVDGIKLGHLSPGHFLYIPAGTAYKLKSKYMRAVIINFDLTTIEPIIEERISPALKDNFDKALCRNDDVSSPFDKYIHIEDMESERDTFILMCNLFTSAEGSFRARVSAMLKLILLKVAETADDNALPARMVDSLDEYIRTNCQDEISNTEIGAIFGYHPFYVSRVLKETKGQTLRQYIISYRLKAAKRLLEFTQKSINEIAEECGFKDASYFTKTFRSAFGMTPKDYRAGFANPFCNFILSCRIFIQY